MTWTRARLKPLELNYRGRYWSKLTHGGSVLSVEVAGLVALEESRWLGLGSRTARKAGIEANYTFHTCGILGGANGLNICQ